MRKLGIGVVGSGWFGRKHLAAWRAIDGARVVAVADPRIGQLTRGRRRSGQSDFHADDHDAVDLGGVALCRTIDELLATPGVDVVDVVTPEAEHFACVMKAIAAGLPVLVEKPFVTNLADARTIDRASARANVPVYVCNILRFDDRVRMLKDKLGSGEVGDLRYFSAKRNFQSSAHAVYGRTHPFFGAMVHDIDLALHLSGERCESVHAEVRHHLGNEMPDVLVATLRFPSGLLCRLENVWHVAPSCPYGFENELCLYGSRSTILTRNAPIVEVWGPEKVVAPEFFFWPTIGGEPGGALRRMLAHYRDCADRRAASAALPLADAVEGMRIAAELVRASERPVRTRAVASRKPPSRSRRAS